LPINASGLHILALVTSKPTLPQPMFDGIAAFLRVAERRSFRAAAEDLGISASAVSQTIKALEARVGVALVARTTRSVSLTEAGERFLERIQPAADGVADAIEAARSFAERPSGLLRITVPRGVAAPLFEPVLAEFCKAYPDIVIEIRSDSALVDIVADGFDAGIRLGELLQADMVCIRLTEPFEFCVVGSPEYLDVHGRPGRPEDLARHRCIQFRQTASGALYRWEFTADGRPFEIAVEGPLITNDEMLLPAMAMQGLGLAYLAKPLVAKAIDQGRLETVLVTHMPTSSGLFLYFPSRAQMLPKLRAFADFMRRAAVLR